MRIFHTHTTGFNSPDPPRCCPKQENITRKALDSEIFVQRPDDRFIRFCHYEIVSAFRDRTARCDGRESRTAAAADYTVDLVSMKEGPASPSIGSYTVGEHGDDGIEVAPGQIAIWIGTPQDIKQFAFYPRFTRCHRYDLLCHDVERPRRDRQCIEHTRANRMHQRGTLDKLVARCGEKTAFGNTGWIHPVAGSSDALQGDRDRSG
jgi:hypothetical protein